MPAFHRKRVKERKRVREKRERRVAEKRGGEMRDSFVLRDMRMPEKGTTVLK